MEPTGRKSDSWRPCTGLENLRLLAYAAYIVYVQPGKWLKLLYLKITSNKWPVIIEKRQKSCLKTRSDAATENTLI